MVLDNEFKINARGLSPPGPRMMVETALRRGSYDTMRIIVSNPEAAEDLKDYLLSNGARVEIDQIGNDFHILADFSTDQKN